MLDHPCQRPSAPPAPIARIGRPIVTKPVDECANINEVFEHALPAFGGARLRRAFLILREAIRREVPLVVTVAGPLTVSDQHRAWLIPLLNRGWVAYLTTTDAMGYHDGHDSLQDFAERPIGEVELFGDDAAYRDAGIIRVADTGFNEDILFQQDRMTSAVLQQPEFQREMTTTERNYLLGKYYAAQEEAFNVRPGLLSTCWRLGMPVFIGAPADGSTFLNSVQHWAASQTGGPPHRFRYDLHADVFEACAYHYWGLFDSAAKSLAILILGGGVPKNYSLQPEPMLSQIFKLPGIRGYDYDVQIVSVPPTFGCLTGCEPAEAVTWGKINRETYQQLTESLVADYSTIMPFIAYALLHDPTLQTRAPLRLFERRAELTEHLLDVTAGHRRVSDVTPAFPLQLLLQAATSDEPRQAP